MEPSGDYQIVLGSSRGNPSASALVIIDLPASRLESVEAAWSAHGRPASSEHRHWNWRHKTEYIERRTYQLVAVECHSEIQGLMAIRVAPLAARCDPAPGRSSLYVGYIEVAPWNLRTDSQRPLYLGVGSALMTAAVRLSKVTGHAGRIGLHGLPQAHYFYSDHCRMTCIGPDPEYYDLVYFEYTEEQADDWLARTEGPP